MFYIRFVLNFFRKNFESQQNVMILASSIPAVHHRLLLISQELASPWCSNICFPIVHHTPVHSAQCLFLFGFGNFQNNYGNVKSACPHFLVNYCWVVSQLFKAHVGGTFTSLSNLVLNFMMQRSDNTLHAPDRFISLCLIGCNKKGLWYYIVRNLFATWDQLKLRFVLIMNPCSNLYYLEPLPREMNLCFRMAHGFPFTL